MSPTNSRPRPADETRLIWIDLETTGLDAKKDELLELAVIFTDKELQELDRWEGVFWRPPGLIDRCGPFIKAMHGAPEHVDALTYSKTLLGHIAYGPRHALPLTTYEAAQKELVGLCWSLGVQPGKGILAGSSVHFDRDFLLENLPQLEVFLSHRHFDTSTLTMATRFWAPTLEPAKPVPAHRAMPDVEHSLQIARHFHEHVMLPAVWESQVDSKERYNDGEES